MSTVFADPPSTPASQSRPQHHHFIPQFVLRTFSPSLQPRTNDNSSPSPRSWKQAKSLKKNASVNFYDIADESLSLQRVAKIYGHRDLYRVEFSHGEGDGGEEVHDPNHVEKKLAQLESQAAVLFKRIRDDADGGKEAFDISRRDKDILRKFLYIMKYRGELFGKKYTLDSINEDHGRSPREKAAVRKLMAEKGFTSLKQVWAHHLRVIMDTPIDCEGNWRRTVRKEMVFDNAENFIAHIDEFFMAFVKPLHPATDEFIVTDNGFGVFEGTVEYDTPYGLQIFEYHNLAPISPRLMLVLRKNILRDTQMNKGLLKLMRSQAVALPGMPPLRISLLEDLPVSPPATPNITALSPNRIPKFTDDDKFVFEISRLSQRHVHRINSIMLTEARSGITFLSTRSMEMSLKAWINDEEFITSTAHPQYADMIQLRQAKIKLLHKLSGDPASVTPALELPTADNNANDYLLHYYKLGKYQLHRPFLNV
jgi:hypothetical protein